MTRLEEVQAKLVGLREWMSVQGLGTVVLNKRANFTWLTAGGDFHVVSASEEGVGRVVVTATGQWVLTSNIEAGRHGVAPLPYLTTRQHLGALGDLHREDVGLATGVLLVGLGHSGHELPRPLPGDQGQHRAAEARAHQPRAVAARGLGGLPHGL